MSSYLLDVVLAFLFHVNFLILKSLNRPTIIDAENRDMYARCGGISQVGTSNGKLKNVGRSVVNAGIIRIRFELCR